MEAEQPSRDNLSQDVDTTSQPAYIPDGVDVALIRWMLSLTPAQRLDVLQQHLQDIARLRNANPDLQNEGTDL